MSAEGLSCPALRAVGWDASLGCFQEQGGRNSVSLEE